MLPFLLSTPMLYVWGVLFGILILAIAKKSDRARKMARAGYLAYKEVEALAKKYGWVAYEKSKPFREALDFILKDKFAIDDPTPKDIAIATESMEKAVAKEKLERKKEESL